MIVDVIDVLLLKKKKKLKLVDESVKFNLELFSICRGVGVATGQNVRETTRVNNYINIMLYCILKSI